MSGMVAQARELAATGVRRALRWTLHTAVPPVDTPGLDAGLARVARLFDLAGQDRQPVRAVRLAYELDAVAWQGAVPDGVRTHDHALQLPADPSGPARPLPVRTYTPAHVRHDDERQAALVHVHGGGFAIGSLRTHDAVCRRLAAGAGVVVHALDYRLAPEHPFPAGLTDIAAGWAELHRRFVAEGGDPARIGIGGDSAGGHAAATVADEAVAPTLGVEVPMPGFCWMVYPGVRVRGAAEVMPELLPRGGLLSGPMVARFASLHVPDEDQRAAPALNPLDAPDEVLAAHPPTWVQTVGFDPLLDQGRAYVERLAANDVDVHHEHEPTMAHGYISMTGVSDGATRAFGRAIAGLRHLAEA